MTAPGVQVDISRMERAFEKRERRAVRKVSAFSAYAQMNADVAANKARLSWRKKGRG